MESGRVPEKGGIRASIEEGKIRVSTGKVKIWASARERRNPGEYPRKVRASIGKYGIRASIRKIRNLDEYQRRARMSTGRRIGERVESGRVPENH